MESTTPTDYDCVCVVSGACDSTLRPTPRPPKISEASKKEFQKIVDLADRWYQQYKGPGWPREDCWDQANSLGSYLASKGPWLHWDVTGVSGERIISGFSVPSGYMPWPLRWEAWNAVGLFPRGTCSGNQAWVLDGFHGYDNSGFGKAMSAPMRAETFWQRFPWNKQTFTPVAP